MAEDKKLSVTIANDLKKVNTYSLFIVKPSKDYMEIQLATKSETEDSINILVENVFRIDKNAMFSFAYDVVNALPTYDSKNKRNKKK